MPHIFGKTKVICWLSHKFVHNKTEKCLTLSWPESANHFAGPNDLRQPILPVGRKGEPTTIVLKLKKPMTRACVWEKKERTLTHNICLEAKTKNSPVGLNGRFCAMQCNLYSHQDFLCPQSKSWPQNYSLSTFQTNLSFIHNIVFPDWKEGFEIWCFIS